MDNTVPPAPSAPPAGLVDHVELLPPIDAVVSTTKVAETPKTLPGVLVLVLFLYYCLPGFLFLILFGMVNGMLLCEARPNLLPVVTNTWQQLRRDAAYVWGELSREHGSGGDAKAKKPKQHHSFSF